MDKVVRRAAPKPFWEAPPTLEEEPEDGNAEASANASPNLSTASDGLKLNMTLQNLGK